MLHRCESLETVLPPTELYNEGWMLRLLLDWFDRNRQFEHLLRFGPDARWYSEALLPSRFLALTRGDPRAESFTHADGVIGHFSVSPRERGDVRLLQSSKQLLVVEAKMGSKLSSGTTNAAGYDQAARNVACMAFMLGDSAVDSAMVDSLGFYVIAPESQIAAGVFGTLVTKESIERKVQQRVRAYDGIYDIWFDHIFRPVLASIDLGVISWEEILTALPPSAEQESMLAFYARCLQFNQLRDNDHSGGL